MNAEIDSPDASIFPVTFLRQGSATMIDPDKSIDALEGRMSNPARFEQGGLPGRLFRACAEPIGSLQVPALRMLLGQDMGTKHIVAYLIEELRRDPNASGDFTHFLELIIENVRPKFWQENPDLSQRVVALISEIDKQIPDFLLESVIFFLAELTGNRSPGFDPWGQSPSADLDDHNDDLPVNKNSKQGTSS